MSDDKKDGPAIWVASALGVCLLAWLPTTDGCTSSAHGAENADTPLSNAESAPAKPAEDVQKLLP